MNMYIIRNVIPFLILTCLLMACHKEAETKVEDVTPLVELTHVRRLQPSISIKLPGELKAWNKSLLYPKVKGYVSSILADRGTTVKKNQILARLEAPELVAAFSEAKARVAMAEAVRIERQSKYKATRGTYQRILSSSRTKGAVSDNELELAYANVLADSSAVRAAEESLFAAIAHSEAQQQLISYLTIRAPFDGTISERNNSPGDLVGPEPGNKPMFTLEDVSKLRLTIAVPENLSNAINTGGGATFMIQAEPQQHFVANYARSARSLLENNRTMITEYDFVNRDGRLKAGMYAEVNLPTQRTDPSLFVPKSSVLHTTEGVFVIGVNSDEAHWIKIEKGNVLDSLVEVFGELKEGDAVVKKVHDELRNGSSVRIKS